MEGDSRLLWIAAGLLLICAMFFAVTETAFASSSRPRLKVMLENGKQKAGTALAILDEFDKAITTILICTNIVHISIATLVTVAVTRRWGVNAVTVSTIITTIAVFFAGEMLPKSIAKKYAEDLALFCAGPLKFFMKVFSPLAKLLSGIGVAFSKAIKGEPELSVTEDELYDIIEDLTEDGKLDEQQGDLISSALQFGDKTVESIMTHRVNFVAVDAKENVKQILEQIKSCTHSRLPVFEDNIDNITGILEIRGFIKTYLKLGEKTDIRKLLSEPFFIPNDTKIDDLLPLMSKNRQSIAIVQDKFGGTFGLVTVEDIVEELVGEIWDEEDAPVAPPAKEGGESK